MLHQAWWPDMIVDDSFDWRLNLRNDLIRDSPDSLININWIACRNLRAPCGGMVHNNDLERFIWFSFERFRAPPNALSAHLTKLISWNPLRSYYLRISSLISTKSFMLLLIRHLIGTLSSLPLRFSSVPLVYRLGFLVYHSGSLVDSTK